MKLEIKILWMIIFLSPFFVFSQSAPDLEDLIQAAIANDGNLNQQKLQHQITQLSDERLKDIFLPRVNLTAQTGYLYTSTNYKTPGLHIPLIEELELNIPQRTNRLNVSGISATAKAEASMLIYSGGKVKYLKEANREKGKSEQILLEKTIDDIIVEISKAYDQFSLLHHSKLVLDASKERLAINRKTADKALSYGLITPYDHQKIELAQAILDSKLIEYEGKRELLITQLHLLTGMERERIAKIDPALQPIDYLVSSTEVDQRAEIRALEHGIQAAENKIKAEEKWWVPKVMAKASVAYMGLYEGKITTSDEIISGSNYRLDLNPNRLHIFPMVQAGIGFQWDIFDGREGKTNVAEAQINKEILIQKKNEAEKLLKLNLANNQTEFEIAYAQIELKNKEVELAQKALKNIEKEFRYGTKTSSVLIEAENDLLNAELELQTAIFNQRRNAIELMRSTQNLKIENL